MAWTYTHVPFHIHGRQSVGDVSRRIIEGPKGKTRNVRLYTIEKIEKQSLKTLCSSLGYGI